MLHPGKTDRCHKVKKMGNAEVHEAASGWCTSYWWRWDLRVFLSSGVEILCIFSGKSTSIPELLLQPNGPLCGESTEKGFTGRASCAPNLIPLGQEEGPYSSTEVWSAATSAAAPLLFDVVGTGEFWSTMVNAKHAFTQKYLG